jgi:hypothetical protein
MLPATANDLTSRPSRAILKENYNGHSIWISEFFFEFTKRLIDLYPDLYDAGDNEHTQDSKFDSSSNFGRKWGLYGTIATLAGNDPTKFDSVTRLNVHECLTYLSYKRDLTILEANQNKMHFRK